MRSDLLTVDEAAEFLRLSRRTVYRLIGLRQLRVMRPRGVRATRIPIGELERFVSNNTKESK